MHVCAHICFDILFNAMPCLLSAIYNYRELACQMTPNILYNQDFQPRAAVHLWGKAAVLGSHSRGLSAKCRQFFGKGLLYNLYGMAEFGLGAIPLFCATFKLNFNEQPLAQLPQSLPLYSARQYASSASKFILLQSTQRTNIYNTLPKSTGQIASMTGICFHGQ